MRFFPPFSRFFCTDFTALNARTGFFWTGGYFRLMTSQDPNPSLISMIAIFVSKIEPVSIKIAIMSFRSEKCRRKPDHWWKEYQQLRKNHHPIVCFPTSTNQDLPAKCRKMSIDVEDRNGCISLSAAPIGRRKKLRHQQPIGARLIAAKGLTPPGKNWTHFQ